MPNFDGTPYKSSFDGFLLNLPKRNNKYATQDEEILAMVEKAMTRLATKYKKVISKKDQEITSLKRSLKKIRKKMKESASVTFAGEEVKFGNDAEDLSPSKHQ